MEASTITIHFLCITKRQSITKIDKAIHIHLAIKCVLCC